MARRRPADLLDDDDDDRPRRGRGRDLRDDDDEDDGPARPKKPGNNAYTGLALLSFVALIAAGVLFYLDASELTASPPPTVLVNVPALGGNVTAAPAG